MKLSRVLLQHAPVEVITLPRRPEGFSGRLVEHKGCVWFIRHVLARLPDDIVRKVAGTIWSERPGNAPGERGR